MSGKTLCTEELIDSYCENLRLGLRKAQAAQAAGISVPATSIWRTRGRNGEEPYATFLAREKEAVGLAERAMVKAIRDAESKDWKAASWMLAKRHPERYAEKYSIDANVSLKAVDMTDEELAKRIEYCMKLGKIGVKE